MRHPSAELARRVAANRWFAPVLWFSIAFITAAITTGR
jgi:hypothetical protein